MLSYPLPEAETLLDDKLQVAQASLANCQEDLDFLREQITVCSSVQHDGISTDAFTDHGGCHRQSV